VKAFGFSPDKYRGHTIAIPGDAVADGITYGRGKQRLLLANVDVSISVSLHP